MSGCYILLCLKPADNACSWLSSLWVAAVPCYAWSNNDCSWLFRKWVATVPCCVVYQLTILSLVLQEVSSCCVLVCFKPTDNDFPWLFSLWVAAVPGCVSCLLTMPILGSPVCEWLLCLTVFQACWQCLSLTLQTVSGWCALLCFRPANNACPLLSRWCVVVMPYSVSSLLTMPIVGPPGSEWLLFLAVFQACWQCLSLNY